MESRHGPEQYREPHVQKVEEILHECRAHSQLYTLPTGIEVNIGGIVWTVSYYAEQDREGEWLSMSRDVEDFILPAAYELNMSGELIKNEKVVGRDESNVYYDANSEHIVTDIDELEILKAIVIAAHRQHE